MMLTLPGKLDLVYRSAAGMRNRFSELEYRSDEHPSRTVRHAGTWLKERVPWGRDMGMGGGRDETHDMGGMELQHASLISTETRKMNASVSDVQYCGTCGGVEWSTKVDCVMDAQQLGVQTRVFLDRPSGRCASGAGGPMGCGLGEP